MTIPAAVLLLQEMNELKRRVVSAEAGRDVVIAVIRSIAEADGEFTAIRTAQKFMETMK